jgi:hypothetical protein
MSTMTFAYRDSLEGARLRYADLAARAREARPFSALVASVFAARTGRIWGGVAGIAGAGLVALAAVAGAARPSGAPVSATVVLLASWAAMGVGYVAGCLVGDRRARQIAVPRETGDVHADLARLERACSTVTAREGAVRMEEASTALPMIAVGLLAPLTLHFAFCFFTGMRSSFDQWIRMSLVIVGHAHVVLACQLQGLARKARGLSVEELTKQRGRVAWPIFGWTVIASGVPGIVLVLLPPVITAVTGVLFLPLLVWRTLGTLIAERRALAA